MKPTFRLTIPCLLAAAACGPATSDVTESTSTTTTAKADPVAETPSEPTLRRGEGHSPDVLDTGIDLSHLRVQGGGAGDAFPSGQPVAGPTAGPTPAGPTVPAGPTGTLALATGEDTKVFGELLEGDTASHVFQLQNSGEHPVVIQRVKPSCGCTAAEIELLGDAGQKSIYQLGDEIPPGTKFELAAELKTAGRRGKMRTNIAIYSNDVGSPFKLQLEADVKPVLVVEPTLLDFQRITSSDVKEGTIKVSTTELDPFMLTLDESRVTEPLTVELKAIDPDAEGKSKSWEVHAKLGPNIPEGIRRYPLRLITDLPQDSPVHDHAHDHDHGEGEDEADHPVSYRELTANIQAQVTGLVIATPNFISLGLVRPGMPVERSVKIESLDEAFALPSAPATRLTSLTGGQFAMADSFTIDVKPLEEGKMLEVTVKLEGLPDDFEGSFGGMVQIDVGHPTKESLNIRFSGVSKKGIPPTSQNNQKGADG